MVQRIRKRNRWRKKRRRKRRGEGEERRDSSMIASASEGSLIIHQNGCWLALSSMRNKLTHG